MAAPNQDAADTPPRAGLILGTLILVAFVANMNLGVCNVALPDIGRALDASQTTLNLTAVGYSLGLAASVLYFGAIGDRYGRKQMLIYGMALSIPAALVAAWAPNIEVLIVARVVGGLSAGMAFPTTLALITALWQHQPRIRAIALWSAVGGAAMFLSTLVSGALVTYFWWGSVFLVSVPLAVLAIIGVFAFVPAHVNESTDAVDNIGGVLSILLVGSLVLAINFVTLPEKQNLAFVLFGVAAVAIVLFVVRQLRARSPLYELPVAARPTFWVAAIAGIISFGALMGSMYIGQQYLQNVLAYQPFEAGLATLPAAICMVFVARVSARLIAARGSRFTLIAGFVFVLIAFILMLTTWNEGQSYWVIAIAYACVGIGVGLGGTPASQSLTASVPVRRVGMASGTADLQRDLGGAIMQSILGALLTAGYAASISTQVGQAEANNQQQISDSVVSALQRSYGSATNVAKQYPAYSNQIITAAREAFLDGQKWAYTAAIVSVLIGIAVVAVLFPRHTREIELITEYHAEDAAPMAPEPAP